MGMGFGLWLRWTGFQAALEREFEFRQPENGMGVKSYGLWDKAA
jgi:hypothetical protein